MSPRTFAPSFPAYELAAQVDAEDERACDLGNRTTQPIGRWWRERHCVPRLPKGDRQQSKKRKLHGGRIPPLVTININLPRHP